MNSSTLKKLLVEYERKRADAEHKASIRKTVLFDSEPVLREIEKELSFLSISTAKSLIQNNDSELEKTYQKQLESLKEKKKEILKKLNLPEDYLQPHYECSICNDTGYVMNDSNFSSTMCSCLKQRIFNIEYNRANFSNMKNQTFENFVDDFYSNEVDEAKYGQQISPRENVERIKKLSTKFIENFDSSDEKNLLFTGNTGLGKTFLSSCIANELLKKGKNVLYQTAPVMLDTIIDYRFGKPNADKSMYDNLLSVDLLIIDDLGTECMNNMKFTELFNVINTRLLNENHITKTIISTNLSLENLYSNYDERIVSRLIGNYNICYFFGEDIRLKKR